MTGKQLKNSILQWAIQGKLVPQDPNDEPASVLLERIRAEKARLIKEGKIKKDKNESIIFRGDDNSHYEKLPNGEVRCIDSEIPFEIPENWCWVRLGILVDFSKSTSVKADKISGDSWLLDLEDIEKDTGKVLVKKRMHSINAISDKHSFKNGNVLYSKLRPYLNKVVIADEDGYCTSEILCFDFGQIYNSYAQVYLMSPYFVEYAMKDAYGVKMPRLGSKQGNNALMPIPPIKEQERIIAKYQDLLPIVEQYGEYQEQLDILNTSLYSDLKKSILQEAIQGRLVEQCEADEPATELLKRIQQEKQKLVKEGKLKKKDLTDSTIFKGDDNKYYEQIGNKKICIDTEIPFEIPSSWCWSRLENLIVILDGYRKPISKAERRNGIYPYYGANGILDHIDGYIFEGEYILVGEDGSVVTPYGNPVVNKASGKIWVNNHAHVLQECGELGYYDYLYYALSTIKITQYIHGFMPKYSQGDLRKTLIPIPPIAEQYRIVVKIEESCGSL